MKSRGLIVASIVLAALSGTLYWSNHKKTGESPRASVETPPKILTINSADITKVEIKKQGGEDITLAKNDAGKWQIISPKQLGADQDAVSSMLSTLSSLDADRLIEEKTGNLDQYGLVQPLIEVDVTVKTKKTEKLLIGDATPAGSTVYAAVVGDPRVFTLPSYNKSSFDKGSKELRDKRLTRFETDKVSRVELSTKKQRIEFGRNKDQWQIVKPRPLRTAQFSVEELVRTLEDAKMDFSGSYDEKKAAAAFNSGTTVATAKVTDASGTQELQVRKSEGDYYAKSSVVEGIYRVASGTGAGLDKSLEDFRNKKLFDFGFVEPDKIEIHDGAKNYSLGRSGADWWMNGTKMDESSVRALVDKIRDLSASKFVDSSFTMPMMDLTVTSKDGKRAEKVLISKNGARYVAKRENEPALYELDAAAVTELEKAGADIRPSTAPKK